MPSISWHRAGLPFFFCQMLFGGMLLFQTGTVYLQCKVRGKQILILPSLQMYRVHGAAVHTGIPIGFSTTGQNTLFPIVSQPKKELLPIILAAAIWGYAWKGKAVLCHCDNVAVVTIINTGTSKEPEAMALLHRLFFIAARNNLRKVADYFWTGHLLTD